MVTAPRFGILGCADIAARKTVPAMATAGLRVTAVASRSAAKAATFTARFGGEAVTGYAALLERPDVDAVYIPLPIALHREWAEAALEAGKHVLVEKTATIGTAAAARLVELATARGLVVMENFAFPHHSQHAEVAELVTKGVVGEPRLITADFGIPPTAPSGIKYSAALGGGSLRETGCYPIRAAWPYLRTPEVAGAVLARSGEVDVSGSALLSDGEVAAQCSFGFVHTYRNAMSVWGSEGRLTLDWAFTPPATTRPVLRLESQDVREERTLPADDQFRNVLLHFASLIGDPAGRACEYETLLTQARLLEEVVARAS
ncbi:Gfo/Idh/MocA family oxidoreductase [Amycolatopsis mediterranei]|uniref:Gfo/Idh/MocA family protein n=1 Tax=Amycolatopsis mediterranei TaxID=33910 RepID=UPI003425AFB4